MAESFQGNEIYIDKNCGFWEVILKMFSIYCTTFVIYFKCNLYLTSQVSFKNKFLFTMTAYPSQTRTTLGQLCAALWDSQSRSDVMQPGFKPGTAVTPLALRCSVLDHCATREPFRSGPISKVVHYIGTTMQFGMHEGLNVKHCGCVWGTLARIQIWFKKCSRMFHGHCLCQNVMGLWD